MKIREHLYEYYNQQINDIEIPETPYIESHKRYGHLLLKPAFALLLALSFIPFICNTGRPSTLAIRAAAVSRYYNLETRIPESISDFHKIVSNSLISGGKK